MLARPRGCVFPPWWPGTAAAPLEGGRTWTGRNARHRRCLHRNEPRPQCDARWNCQWQQGGSCIYFRGRVLHHNAVDLRAHKSVKIRYKRAAKGYGFGHIPSSYRLRAFVCHGFSTQRNPQMNRSNESAWRSLQFRRHSQAMAG